MLCAGTRFLPDRHADKPEQPAAPLTALLSALVLCAGCGGPTPGPEAAVRAWVDAGERAAEDRDRRALLAMIDDGYADARGNDKERLGDLFRVYFFRQQSVSLLTSIDAIEIHGDSAADVSLTVGMAGTNDSTFGISADAYRFELELVKSGDDWRLIGARWGELGDELR